MDGQLEVEIKEIRTPDLDAMYSEIPVAAGVRIKKGLPYDEVEALIYEATIYLEDETVEGGRKWMFTPKYYERMDRRRIEDLKKHIVEDKPHWVKEIKDVMRSENCIYWIVNLSGVPPYPGVAITEALQERGDVPDDIA